MQSVTLLDTTGGLLNVTGTPQRAAGYNNSIGNNHTVSVGVNNFAGRIYIEGTLVETPDELDWVPIPVFNSQPYIQFPLNPASLIGTSLATQNAVGDTGNFVYNFTGNFIWVRARVDRSYLVPPPTSADQVGNVIKIMLNYGAVAPASTSNWRETNQISQPGPPGPQGLVGPTGPIGVTGPTGSVNSSGETGAVQYSLGQEAFGGSTADLFFNPVLKRLGVNTQDVSEASLHVVGSAPALFNTLYLDDYTLCLGNSVSSSSAILGMNPAQEYGYLKLASEQQMLTWNASGVGINNIQPINALDVAGGIVIGGGLTYAGATQAPINGALIQGSVGIGSNSPKEKLDVMGGNIKIGSMNAGILFADGSFINSANVGLTGPTGPVATPPLAIYQTSVFTALPGQTSFPVEYQSNVDVYVDGNRLLNSQFTATDNQNVVLSTPLLGNELVNIIVWQSTGVLNNNAAIVFSNPCMFTSKLVLENIIVAENDTLAAAAGVDLNQVYRSLDGNLRIRLS